MSSGIFVLILKCTEAPTVPSSDVATTPAVAVAGEDTNAYEKIHMYQLNNVNDVSLNGLKKFNIAKKDKNDGTNNHAIIFIKLINGEIDKNDGYQEIKYFDYKDISNTFIPQIDTATEMNCYQSTYAIKGITPDPVVTYKDIKLEDNTKSKNILINNGGKIVVTSSQNNDQLILHYVSKMFGFEDIIKDLGDTTVSGGGDDDDVEGGETSDFTAEELAEYQNQMEHQQQNQNQQGGKKKRTKQNTKKRNQK